MCTLVNALWGNKIGTVTLEGTLTVPIKIVCLCTYPVPILVSTLDKPSHMTPRRHT